MGEIATWSAVKTKVGLGKDSNECPTKAELLALSPTGTGENYVGLEISNASSYGNNETVQLNDIHKVTYKYIFTAQNTTLSFPKEGGTSTQVGIYVTSTKTKYLDGSATSEVQNVNYPEPNWPSWIIGQGPLVASENTTTESRSATVVYTQSESGKQISVSLFQAAGVETWEYTFSVQNPNLNYTALGGSATPAIAGYNSFKQRYINGKPVGTSVDVGFSSPDLPSWIFMDDENHYTALENKSENSRSQVFTSTQNESGKKVTVTFAQLAGVKTYGTPTVYLGSIADIPASGGTAATPTYTYSQLWGWNGKTNDGGTISSGASVVWSENISGSNLGTTAKARTKLGSRTLTVTLNGKSGSASIDVYQAENRITNVTQGAWVVSISANPSTLTEMGGTSQISASARASRINHWSSGATNAASDATGTPTLSIPTAVTGFSLSGTTLTVAENKTANQRSVVVRATMDTVYKEITVTQSVYLVEWQYTFTASPTTLSFDALGTAKSITITSYREKYINGSLVEGSRENVSYIHATSTEHIGTVLGTSISMQENQTTSTRSGQVSYEQNGSNKVIRITCNQAAGTISTRDVLEVVDNFGDSPAVGGSIFGLVKSGYYNVINGKDSTWHNVTPTLKSKSSYITNVEITKASGDGYNIEITLSENTSESSRRASLTLTYGSKEVDMATTQAGASVSYNYYIGFKGNPDVEGYSMNWEYTQFGSSHGQSIDLKCWRKLVINGIESDTEEAAEYEVIFRGVGIDSFTVTNTPLSYDPTITTVRAYPKSINGSVFDLKGTVQYRIADYPSKSAYLYLTHKPVATVKRWTFQWYDQVESITMKNVSHGSSAGSISPITITSKCEYLLASNQSQVAYTEYIKPNEDEDTATPVSWGRLVENGQTAKNDYNYAYLVDENKEDYERQATRTFTQPGNPSNKRLYLYVTQTKPVTIKQEFHAELGNYYSYGDSNQIPLIYQVYSPDFSDTTDIGDMTPGGYIGVWCNLPATGVINCMITGKPQTGKPMKARLSNLQARTIENFDSSSPTEINKGLSVGYSQRDYQIGIEYSPGMNNYFLITPSILSEAGAYGGGIRLEVSLRSSYSSNGTTIATVTLTPKNSDHPTIYFEVIYG